MYRIFAFNGKRIHEANMFPQPLYPLFQPIFLHFFIHVVLTHSPFFHPSGPSSPQHNSPGAFSTRTPAALLPFPSAAVPHTVPGWLPTPPSSRPGLAPGTPAAFHSGEDRAVPGEGWWWWNTDQFKFTPRVPGRAEGLRTATHRQG